MIFFLPYIPSRSNNLGTIRIDCRVLQPTKKAVQCWSMPRDRRKKKAKNKKKKHYLKERHFSWKKFLWKIFSRLSSGKFNFCWKTFSRLTLFIISIPHKFLCKGPPSYLIMRNFHSHLLIRTPQLINYS